MARVEDVVLDVLPRDTCRVEPHGDVFRVDHALCLFDSDQDLVRGATKFLAEGLALGERVFAIMTEAHWQGVCDGLDKLAVAHGRAAEVGKFILIDADYMLDDIIVDGVFDPQRFTARLRPLLEPPGTKQRICGEMSAMLAARDNLAAALALEEAFQALWHDFRFHLLCAVNVSAFTKDVAQDTLRRLRERHSQMTRRDREHS